MDSISKYLIQAYELLNSGRYKETLSLLNESEQKGTLKASNKAEFNIVQK
ncbi:MAG: hypothetical protein ACFE9Z_00295 [Promethearchaeota archaeon]